MTERRNDLIATVEELFEYGSRHAECSFGAVACRVLEIKSLSISDKLRAVNYSILSEITDEIQCDQGSLR